MIDDTRGTPCLLTASQLAKSVQEISQHRTNRIRAKGWAHSLRFLTTDGMSSNFSGSRSNLPLGADGTTICSEDKPRESCERCERGTAAPRPAHICNSHRDKLRNSSLGNRDLSEPLNACDHVTRLTCSYCRHVPLFPKTTKTTRFRIRRVVPKIEIPHAYEEGKTSIYTAHDIVCGHFVAVSYCWNQESSLATENELARSGPRYTVVEEDGSVRYTRAPHTVIDRALTFARENGYRLIWIDQECIQQDDRIEKSIGVQAMDYVYAHADITIGLCSAILRQPHLDNLLFFEEDICRTRGIALTNAARLRPVANRVISDPMLAEAFKGVINDPWHSRAWILQEAFLSFGNLVLLFPRRQGVETRHLNLVCGMSMTEVCLDFQMLQDCLKIAAKLVHQRQRDSDLHSALQRFERFKIDAPKTMSGFDMKIGGGRSRDTCNAATALAYLRYRDNSVVTDRLAIIANMCSYGVRLKTETLEQSQESLSICVLALALINGDFSLLVPENYHASPLKQFKGSNLQTMLMTCIQGFPYLIPSLPEARGPTFGPAAPASYHFTGKSLRIPGFLWKVDQRVCLQNIRSQYHQAWGRLRDQRLVLMSQYRHRLEQHNHQLRPEISVQVHRERRKRAITQVLFDILKELRDRGDIVTADAIWQSVWDPAWRNTSRTMVLVDSVTKFPSDVNPANRKRMFDLHEVGYLVYHPEWLIDLVMDHGSIHTASLIRNAEQGTRAQLPSGAQCAGWKRHRAPFEDMIDEANRSFMPRFAEDCDNGDDPEAFGESIIRDEDVLRSLKSNFRLMGPAIGSMLAYVHEVMVSGFDMYPKSSDLHLSDVYDTGFAQHLGLLCMFSDEGGFSQHNLLHGQRAIFDMNGMASDNETLVLTPFQLPLENGRVSSLRTMSMSHVVERVSEGDCDSKYDTFRTKRLVRGLWQMLVMPGGR